MLRAPHTLHPLSLAAALALSLSASAAQADGTLSGQVDGAYRSPRQDRDGGFEGQIAVPTPFPRGAAFLLVGEEDCGVLHRHWLRMAQDTRDPEERAAGVETPGLPIACAQSGNALTCKIFKDGFTAAFTAAVTADSAAELRFRTPGGYLDAVVQRGRRAATLTQTAYGRSSVCQARYKGPEEAAEDVARLDPAELELPVKGRGNGTKSGGDRLKCKSRHDARGAADPLTGRRTALCSPCTGSCGFAGEECRGGVCVYTGKGDYVPASRPAAGPAAGSGGGKRRGKGLGQSCKTTAECEEGRVCSQRTPRLRTCQ